MVNKKSDKSDKMTIDKLAIMVAKGFESVATKDDLKKLEERMNGKFEGVKKEIEGVKDQLVGTNKRIDDLAETKVSKIIYEGLEKRVQKIEAKI